MHPLAGRDALLRTAVCIAVSFVSAAAAAPPPVILISIDTLRADHLSAYGYRAIRTPNIDSFADGGTLFENAECQVPLTLPSHTSLFTSTYPFENRVEENGERVPSQPATLASVLKLKGYRTAAFVGSVFLEREMGLDQGFDLYDSPFHFEAFSPISGSMFFGAATHAAGAGRDRRDGALVIRAAEQWLSAQRPGDPVFVFLHLFDIHKPYLPHAATPPHSGVSPYDQEIEYVDSLIGAFRKTLEKRGWWKDSIVVLLSDHGEALGDHSESSHGYFVYESTTRTPLIIHWPAGAGAALGPRVNRPIGLIDLAPSLLDVLHIPAPPSFEGRSFLHSQDVDVYSETLHAHDAFGWSALRSIRRGTFKYIEAPRPELYNLQSDPKEHNNLAIKDRARANEMRSDLRKLLAQYPPKAPANESQPSSKMRAMLESLGYLSPGPAGRIGAPEADPKDRLAEFQLYEEATLLVYNGRLSEAEAALNRLLAHDPNNILARRDLGACYLEQHAYRKARAAFEYVLRPAPNDYMTQFELGIADEHLGLIDEAREHLEAACRIAPEAQQCHKELDALHSKK